MKNLKIFLLLTISVSFNAVVQATHLETQQAKKITVVDSLSFTGTVEAVNTGTASSETLGRVTETLVDVGDIVSIGDVILKLRDTQQKAKFDSAVASVSSAEVNFDTAEKEYVRVSDILKKGLVSQSVADQALSQRVSAKAALDTAKANLKTAKEQLDYTRVKAPYSGIVLERHVEVGETVNVGSALYTGMSLEYLRVVADVPQKDIDNIRQHKSAIIELSDGNEISISNDALTFFGYADPKTSTFKIRVNLPANTEGLYPGMYLRTSFVVGKKTSLVIPQSSLVKRGEVNAVYVQNEHRISLRQIRPGRIIYGDGSGDNDEDTIEVLSGLSEGDLIVTVPADAITIIQSQVATKKNDGAEDE